MTCRIDFTALVMKAIDGSDMRGDIKRDISNHLYMQGHDIEEAELGRKIFNTPKDQPTELTPEEIAIIKRAAEGYPYVVREALNNAIRQE